MGRRGAARLPRTHEYDRDRLDVDQRRLPVATATPLGDGRSRRVQWLLIADPRHVNYLSNFWVHPLSFSAGERGLLLLERDNGATLLCDNSRIGSSSSEPHCRSPSRRELVRPSSTRPSIAITLCSQALEQVAPQLGRSTGTRRDRVAAGGRLGVASRGRRPESAAGADAFSLGSAIRQLRRQKEPDEMTLLRQCMRAADAGHARAWDVIRTGVSEMDVFREVQQAVIATAARPGLIYGDFRATTKKQPDLGGLPTAYRLRLGDLFILDFSVVLNGYRSDFTNTIAVGVPTIKQQETFQICAAALQERRIGAPRRDSRSRRVCRRFAAVCRRRQAAAAAPRRARHRAGASGTADLRSAKATTC